jgi:hypothetical protein
VLRISDVEVLEAFCSLVIHSHLLLLGDEISKVLMNIAKPCFHFLTRVDELAQRALLILSVILGRHALNGGFSVRDAPQIAVPVIPVRKSAGNDQPWVPAVADTLYLILEKLLVELDDCIL